MNGKTFHLTVITPGQVFFDGQVGSLTAPGGAGSFGVLANHAPLISTLLPGRITFTTAEGKKQTFEIGSGFIDIMKNDVTLLTESITSEDPSKSS